MFDPEKIIAAVTEQHGLSMPQEEELRQILAVPGMREIVENNILNIEALLHIGADHKSEVLPSHLTKMVVDVYHYLQRESNFFKRGEIQLSDMVLWLTLEGRKKVFPFVIWPALVQQHIVDNHSTISVLKDVAYQYPTEMAQWFQIQKNFESLEQLTRAQGQERKRLVENTREILQSLGHFFMEDVAALSNEAFKIIRRLSPYRGPHTVPLEGAAIAYFQKLFQTSQKHIIKISFADKPWGDLLGLKMTIQYTENDDAKEDVKEISYFIKTHQEGSRDGYEETGTVDPKELFVYRVLEYIGFGPPAHFFFDTTTREFFIATQDLAFSPQPHAKKLFKVLDCMLEENDIERLCATQQGRLIHSMEKGLVAVEVLSRILRLEDIIQNFTNFGCIMDIDGAQDTKWKIIDFQIKKRRLYYCRQLFGGFQYKNGTFFCFNEFILALKGKPALERIMLAKQVIDELQGDCQCDTKDRMSFLQAIRRSYCEVVNITKQYSSACLEPTLRGQYLNRMFGDLKSMSFDEIIGQKHLYSVLDRFPLAYLGDFGRYVKGINDNFTTFADQLSARLSVLCQVIETDRKDEQHEQKKIVGMAPN